MEGFVQETIKKVYNTYVEYQKKADVFYVAFSGGKDSIVTLDIVQRALPHNAFKVLFGDTGMEFPDTYKTVALTEDVQNLGIEFIRAKSELSPNIPGDSLAHRQRSQDGVAVFTRQRLR